MIKFENVVLPSAEQWRAIILGARNPFNSWEKSDSHYCNEYYGCEKTRECDSLPNCYEIGPNDFDLMRRLAADGPVHAKYRRMITVYVDITAPLYWWKEFDTYKVGTVANSCCTMHKIAEKKFTIEDFSCEHLIHAARIDLGHTIDALNFFRGIYLHGGMAKDEAGNLCGYGKKSSQIWWQMIQLLPSSYNQKRTVMMNYEVLANIYKSRKDHKLDEWAEHKAEMIDVTTSEDLVNGDHRPHLVEGVKEYFGFCDWIKTLPYSELITGESTDVS